MSDPKRLGAAEYQMTQDGLMLVAGILDQYDLDAFLLTADTADTLVPMIDPTLWRKGHKRLDGIMEIARKARDFQQAVREFRAQVESEVAK
jgi:hypothetical protein